MYSIIRNQITLLFLILFSSHSFGQSIEQGISEFEAGLAVAGAEAFYCGVYSKYHVRITKSKHSLKAGIGLNAYFDFAGESEAQAYLENDVDMRMIPHIFIGYELTFRRFGISVELPVGTSIAITKGKLINERIGFERRYSNTEYFWHHGLEASVKYRLNDRNKIGLRAYMPTVKDYAQTSPMLGLGWIWAL